MVAMPLIGHDQQPHRQPLPAGALGFGIFGVCGLWFARVNLDISQWSMLWPVIISGFGASMVFVPLATTSMANLPNEEIGNAAGLFNLLRNIGGSIGISIVNTVVARHEQLHRVELSAHITATSTAFQQMLSGAMALTATQGRLTTAGVRSHERNPVAAGAPAGLCR